MTDFKVLESGWYRTRDGEFAEVVVNSAGYGVAGYIYPHLLLQSWHPDGSHAMNSPVTDDDLVEYLGKERPKQKKVVRMAPALIKEGGNYFITGYIYPSAETAKTHYPKEFIRWLIDTHSVEVEVEG